MFHGEAVWANPMEDGRVADGRAECIVSTRNRSILDTESAPLENPFLAGECLLVLQGTPGECGKYQLELTATAADGKPANQFPGCARHHPPGRECVR